MSNASSKKVKSNEKSKKEVKVLYQNLGGSLYAFTEINGQVFFGKVPVKQSTKSDDAGATKSGHRKTEKTANAY